MPDFSAVKELRKRLGLTQQELAVECGLAVRTVSVYETGKTPGSLGVLYRFMRLAKERGHEDLIEALVGLNGH